MRDPEGQLELLDDSVRRHLRVAPGPKDFLNAAVAGSLQSEGRLIPFRFESASVLVAPRVPFVTAPTEWCYSQFHDAARLTLDIADSIDRHGFELKDASAWNVVFEGTQPRFCDHLSYVHKSGKRWWAMGQFFRHFVFPLRLAAAGLVWPDELFRINRDGVQADRVRRMLGWRRFTTRHWLAMMDATPLGAVARQSATSGSDERKSLLALCDWMLRGLQAHPDRRTTWIRYTQERNHYSDHASEVKRSVVSNWLRQLKPRRVLDLGCNTGEHTALALERGAEVVALDGDRACVDALYRQFKHRSDVWPVVADLGDLSGGRGWAGSEHPGLISRLAGRCDVLMALGLLHHLLASESVPMSSVVDLFEGLGVSALIVELVPPTDVRVIQLCQQRNRPELIVDIAAQRAALEQRFQIEAEVCLPDSERRLVLCKRR